MRENVSKGSAAVCKSATKPCRRGKAEGRVCANFERLFYTLLITTLVVLAGGVGSNVNLSTSSSEHNPTLLQYA